MTKLGVTIQRLALLSVMAGATSACWPGDDTDGADSNYVPLEQMYPTVFMGDTAGAVLSELRAELDKLRQSDPEEYVNVVRGMAQIVALKDLTVTAQDMSKDIPELSPYDDLPEPQTRQFLQQFFDVASDRLSQGGMTFESIQKIGAAHEQNAGTKYRNALFKYLEALRAKRQDLEEKDKQLKEVVALISFIQPQLQRDGDELGISVQTQNGTELRLSSVEITVAALDPEIQFSSPEAVGSARVEFDVPFEPGESMTLDFSVEAPDYEGGSISLEVTKLSTASGFDVAASAMEEPLDLIDDLISDAEWARQSVRDDLARSLKRYP